MTETYTEVVRIATRHTDADAARGEETNMISRSIGGICLAAVTALVGAGVPAIAASASTNSKTQANHSQSVSRLLSDVKTDAQHVRGVADHFDQLTKNPSAISTSANLSNANATTSPNAWAITASERNFNPAWEAYDRQWNEIKPVLEDMQLKMARLDSMESSATPAERTQIDQAKKLVGEMQARMHRVHELLNQQNVQTTDPAFHRDARQLRTEAASLAKTS